MASATLAKICGYAFQIIDARLIFNKAIRPDNSTMMKIKGLNLRSQQQ